MICNAVHPEAEVLATVGVVVEPCHLNAHAEGRHCFHTQDTTPENDPPRPVRVHMVRTLTTEQWRAEVAPWSRFNTPPNRALADLSEHLGLPVGIVVRTDIEGGGPDAA